MQLELARRTESDTQTTSAAATSYTFDNAFYATPTVNITPHDLDPMMLSLDEHYNDWIYD